MNHLARRPFAELSGGEQRRVSLARAFAQDPLLLVLDEPTAGLDQKSREVLLELIESAAGERGIAVLMVTHDPFDHSLGGPIVVRSSTFEVYRKRRVCDDQVHRSIRHFFQKLQAVT